MTKYELERDKIIYKYALAVNHCTTITYIIDHIFVASIITYICYILHIREYLQIFFPSNIPINGL